MKIKVKLMAGGKMPEFKRDGDACLDCYSVGKITIKKGDRVTIPLGFCLQLPKGYEAVIRPRSGLSGCGIDSVIGTIDSNYRGELKAILINNSIADYSVETGDRICQLAIRKTEKVKLIEVKELNKTNRGANGFGSSGR